MEEVAITYPPYPPHKNKAQFRVRMGENQRSEFFNACPIGLSRTDEVDTYLAAYNYFKDFGEWPPGRRNPRVVTAFMIIEKEIKASLPKEQPVKPQAK